MTSQKTPDDRSLILVVFFDSIYIHKNASIEVNGNDARKAARKVDRFESSEIATTSNPVSPALKNKYTML